MCISFQEKTNDLSQSNDVSTDDDYETPSEDEDEWDSEPEDKEVCDRSAAPVSLRARRAAAAASPSSSLRSR